MAWLEPVMLNISNAISCGMAPSCSGIHTQPQPHHAWGLAWQHSVPSPAGHSRSQRTKSHPANVQLEEGASFFAVYDLKVYLILITFSPD